LFYSSALATDRSLGNFTAVIRFRFRPPEGSIVTRLVAFFWRVAQFIRFSFLLVSEKKSYDRRVLIGRSSE
jgi:hypothetical protein